MAVVEAEALAGSGTANVVNARSPARIDARSYQRDLIEVATDNNVIISLATGAGKTLIAAEVIRRKLPKLRETKKAVLFLAPTNPLVAQQCDVALGGTHGFTARAYHGSANNHHMSSWDRAKWEALVEETDVLVMTPDVLLHTLSHGVFRMSDIGLMVFDEAHHCKSDHPYNQLLQDFYHPLPPADRPQILGLTASPDGVEPDTRRRKGRPLHMGLQHNMNAFLITVPAEGPLRQELSAAVPWPSTQLLTYQAVPAEGVIRDSLTWLSWMKNRLLRPAKRCEQICEMLRRQELLASAGYMEAGLNTDTFEGFAEGGRVSALDKQIQGVFYCLENLGPWCAAAAAYLDLLAPPDEGEVEHELQEEQLDDPDLNDGDDDDDCHKIQPQEEEEDSDDPGIPIAVGGDSCRIYDDELGGPPEVLLQELRYLLADIISFLQLHAEDANLSFIITPDKLQEALTPRPHDLPAAAAAAEAARQNGAAQAAGGTGTGTNELEWCARGVLRLACRVALLITMNVLADVLVDDTELKQALMQDAGGATNSSEHVERRSSGSLQGFAEVLLRRVPFSMLEAQIWPELYTSQSVRPWHGPRLFTHKVTTLLRLLEVDRQRCMQETADRVAAAAACGGSSGDGGCSEDWWSSMVFVETKLSALVLSRLLMSLPLMRLKLRSGYLLGDTRSDRTTGGLAMNNKQQALVVAGFRTSAINVLIATSVGSEGMDFKQCQLVVAFDLPRDVTSYIQCRGRGRKAGSKYCFMQQEEHKENIHGLIRKADRLEARMREISEENRKRLEQHARHAAGGGGDISSVPRLEPRAAEESLDNNTRLMTGVGAVVTTRLAQQMLAEYCAKLPGSDRSTPLQAYYSTRVSGGLFHTIVYLPSNAGVQTKVDYAPPGLSSKQAKQNAALQVLRLLYQAGKLNEHLQPVWITQKHSKQLEAEPIPHLTSELRLRRPLHPRLLAAAWQEAQPGYQDQHQAGQPVQSSAPSGLGRASSGQQQQQQQAERTLVLHLHTFVYGHPGKLSQATVAANTSNKHQATAGTDSKAAAVAEQQRAAEASLLAAVVGSDDAVAALPGGPTVAAGLGELKGQLSFGVLLWERLPDNLMRWPVWIEKKLYVMDVLYAGAQLLTESQVKQLLGYQCAINKHINWDKTRAQWLKIARELDQQEAAEAAAAAAPGPSDSTAAGLLAAADSAAPMDVDGLQPQNTTPTAPVAGSSGCPEQQAQQEEVVQRQPILPFKPELLKDLMHWERGQQQQQQQPAAAVSGGPDETWSPPDRMSYLIVPVISTNSSGSSSTLSIPARPAAAAAAAAVSTPASPSPGLSSVKPPAGLPGPESFISGAGGLAGDLTGARTGAGDSSEGTAVAAGHHSTSTRGNTAHVRRRVGQGLEIDWSSVQHMSSGLLPLSHFISQHFKLPETPTVPADRMELPPLVPPEPVSEAMVAAAAAAGEPVPLKGAAAMAAIHPSISPTQVLALEQSLQGRVVVAGHSSHVYTALGIAGGLTPATSLSESIMKLAKQLKGDVPGLDQPGIISTPVNGATHSTATSTTATAAASKQGTAPAAAAQPGASPAAHVSTSDTVMTNLSNSWAALLSSKNPQLAAAVMLSSSMVEHDPEQRPMLGWKVGKTDDGLPIWSSVDRHDDYYRVRSGVTGLRPDLPMLAVKSSRGLTDSCLVPPKEYKNVINMPAAAAADGGLGSEQQQQGTNASMNGAADPPAGTGLGSNAAPTTASIQRPDQAAVSSMLTPSKRARNDATTDEDTGASKCRRVSAGGDVATAADQSDRLAPSQHSEPPCFTVHELPAPDAIAKESAQLADMSRSGRRKVWAQHRVMFLPLELAWLLPITSAAWSQLQLIPNIIYRLDSMLQAVSMHGQLQELLHGGGAAAAGQVYNAPAGPDAEDVKLAAADGWVQPAGLHDLMSGVSHRQLLSKTDQQQPEGPESQAAGASPCSQATAAAAANDMGQQAADQDLPAATPMAVDSIRSSSIGLPTTSATTSAAAGDAAGSASAALSAPGSSSSSSGLWQDVPLPSPTLLLVSLTASSCHETFDLERLEFLGDVILKVLTSHVLLKAFPPDANEGELSVAKARIIRNLRLAQLGRFAPLYLQYQLRSFPYDNSIWTPTGTKSVLGLFEDGLKYTCKGKRIADGVESLIGAFYLAGAAKEAAMRSVAAAAGTGGGDSSDSGAAGLDGGGSADVSSWVWHRVSRGGLVAAAAFCEVVGVLPAGAARYLTSSPMPQAPRSSSNSSEVTGMSLLHPSYSSYYNKKLGNPAGAAGGAGSKVALTDRLAERYANRIKKLPAGAFPYTFRDPCWLVQSVTHVSVLGCSSYQRLEFLGDALMDLLISLRTLSAGRQQHLDPAALTKARARAVSNNMMATAAVMSGLHLLVHANSWRLLVGVRRFAKETLALYGKLPTNRAAASGGAETPAVGAGPADGDQRNPAATAAAIRLAANAGVLGRAAIAAESAGASKETVLAAAAAAASKAMAAAAAGALGAGTAALASRLSQDVLDDDTLWMAVWLRRKELAALQAAAAKAAKEAAAAAAKAAAAGTGGDADMADATAGSHDIATELQQQVTAAAEAAAETQVAKRKFPKVLADLIESLTAAVYVDSGGDWESTWQVGEYLLCRHQEELERLEAEQQHTQQRGQVQKEGKASGCEGSEEDDVSDEESGGLLMLLPEGAE